MAAAVQDWWHMVHLAPPGKATVETVFEVSRSEDVPVWKGERVHGTTNKPGLEVFLTHRKGISDDVELAHALAELGCPESVIVVEAVKKLEVQFNTYYNSMRKLLLGPLTTVLRCIGTELSNTSGDGLFSRFAYALHQASKFGEEHAVVNAARASAQLFWDVTDAVIEDNGGQNDALQWMVSSPDARVATIMAWSFFYTMRTQKDVRCHPFAVIDGDTDAALRSLSVLKFLGDKYARSDRKVKRDLSCLIAASVPLLISNLEKEVDRAQVLTMQEAADAERIKGLLLPRDDEADDDDIFEF